MISIIQHARKVSTVAEAAHLRRSLQGRVAVVTASTDGSVIIEISLIQCNHLSHI